MEETFKNAKVGDPVYSLSGGWGNIIETEGSTYPIRVSFNKNGIDLKYSTFTWDGKRFDDDITPDLYWDEPEIIVPPRPKRIVKHEVNVWVNHYSIGNICIHTKKEGAATNVTIGGIIAPGKLSYEIEE